MTPTLLKIDGLVKRYETGGERLTIFDGFSLALNAGETLAVTGESGSGKSTLLNLIAGLDAFQSGAIVCSGYNVGRLNEKELSGYRNCRLGFIFQFHFLLKDFTALENVLMPALIGNAAMQDAERRALNLLARVDLNTKLKNYPDELSGGERQRVAIARALMNSPDLILADEPTGSLDDKNSRIVEQLLFNLLQEEKKSMILVTHDRMLAQQCGRHIELRKGAA
jgi:lipoprotein-releasing system ATP-binding protein